MGENIKSWVKVVFISLYLAGGVWALADAIGCCSADSLLGAMSSKQ